MGKFLSSFLCHPHIASLRLDLIATLSVASSLVFWSWSSLVRTFSGSGDAAELYQYSAGWPYPAWFQFEACPLGWCRGLGQPGNLISFIVISLAQGPWQKARIFKLPAESYRGKVI